jgi:hypothetical protein
MGRALDPTLPVTVTASLELALQTDCGYAELGGCPGQGGIPPGRDVSGALLAGQVVDCRLGQHGDGQRAGVAEPGGVYRRGDDRLPIRVTAGPLITVDQIGEPRPGTGSIARGCPVPAAARSSSLNSSGTSMTPPPTGSIRSGVWQRLEEHPGGRGGAGPGLRGRAGDPVPGPDGGDDQLAVTVMQVIEAAQHLVAAVSSTYNFLGMSARSGSDAWAVGIYGNNTTGAADTLILHWNGTAWSKINSPTVQHTNFGLDGVSAVSGSDA